MQGRCEIGELEIGYWKHLRNRPKTKFPHFAPYPIIVSGHHIHIAIPPNVIFIYVYDNFIPMTLFATHTF